MVPLPLTGQGGTMTDLTAIDANTVDIVNGFIPNALRTLSPAWHGDKVAKHNFVKAVNAAIDAANQLDKIKKTLFYGRDNNLEGALGQENLRGLPALAADHVDGDAANIIHAIIGKFTEAGELLEAMKAWLNGAQFDRVNAIEEIGDGFWYDAVLLDEMESSFPDAMARVIAKLRARFPDKFTEANANERNLESERAILENATGAGSYRDPAEPEPTLHEVVERIADGTFYDDYDLASRSLGVLRQAVAETNGGDYAPLEASDLLGDVARPLGIAPAEPASGKEAVNRAEAAANQAFTNVGKIDPLAHYVEAAVERSNEHARGIGERLAPMPGEQLSRQLVRKSDIEKS